MRHLSYFLILDISLIVHQDSLYFANSYLSFHYIIKYNILNVQRKVKTDIVDIEIENKFYKIMLNNGLLESYLFYNKKDTVNFKAYKNIIADFYF